MKRQPENDMKEKKHEENICKIKPQELEKKFRWWAALREILEQQEERNPLRDGKGNG